MILPFQEKNIFISIAAEQITPQILCLKATNVYYLTVSVSWEFGSGFWLLAVALVTSSVDEARGLLPR